jgi:hypothetical protein
MIWTACGRVLLDEPLAAERRLTGISTVAKKKRNARDGKSQRGDSQRKLIVFTALLAVMTVTSALLLALAPAPLTPGTASSLLASGTPDSLEAVFQTSKPVEPTRWNKIYVHQSRTASGNASTLAEAAGGLADHFVIGNGEGSGDGEIQIAQRWHHQKAAGRAPGGDASCISICLIGDFNATGPTPTQLHRLTQLLAALQDRCAIPAGNVQLIDTDTTSAGVGRQFPTAAVRGQLLP